MAHGQPSYRIDCDYLRRLREGAGFSLKDFGTACEQAGRAVSAPQISNYENGKHQPRPAVLKAMAAALSRVLDEPVSTEDLLRKPDQQASEEDPEEDAA